MEEEDTDTWETVTLFEENELVKQAKPRARERLDSSEPGVQDAGPSATGDGATDNGAGESGNEEQSTIETTSHGIPSLCDGVADIKLDVDQNITASKDEVHLDVF